MFIGRNLGIIFILSGLCSGGLAQVAILRNAISEKGIEDRDPTAPVTRSTLSDPVVSTTIVVNVTQKDQKSSEKKNLRPFSTFAIGAKASSLGFGAEIATPLARSLNLRAGVNGFNLGYGFDFDDANYYFNIRMRTAQFNVDWFPFHGGFHISPGVLLYESNLSGTVKMAAGKSFDLGNATYTSSTTDPVHGSAGLTFSRTVMPSVMFGWGNLLPRSGRRLSVPFEIGAAYMGHTAIALDMQGTACGNNNVCQNVSAPSIQTNIQVERENLNESIKRLQAYPIISTGMAFRF